MHKERAHIPIATKYYYASMWEMHMHHSEGILQAAVQFFWLKNMIKCTPMEGAHLILLFSPLTMKNIQEQKLWPTIH